MAAALAGLALALLAATAAPAVERGLAGYVAEAWTTERGLPQNSVNAVAQTPDGYLWVATFGGLARFDGVRFRIFDAGSEPALPSSRITALLVDRGGALWIGTEDAGVSTFDGVSFSTPPGLGGVGETVWALAEDAEGAIWIATSSGALRWGKGRLERFGVEEGLPWVWVRAFFLDDDGTFWVGSLGGASRQVGERFETVVESPVWSFAQAADGRLLGIGEQGVVDVAGPSPGKLDVAATALRASLRDSSGALWLGGEKLGRVPPDESGCEFDAAERFGRRVRTLFEDRDGGLWAGTDAHGLLELRPRRASSFGRLAGLLGGPGVPGDSTLPIFEDDRGTLWVGSCSGLSRFDGARFHPVDELDDSMMRCVSALAPAADGGLWVGARGVRKLGGAPRPGVAAAVGDRYVHALLERGDGSLWIATTNGVARLGPNGLGPLPEIGGSEAWALVELGDGRVGVGLRGEVAIVDGGAVRRFAVVGPGLERTQVRDLWLAPDGALWAATYGAGLARIGEDGKLVRFDRSHGLAENFVSRILDDGAGHLWLSGNRGIYRVALSELAAVAAGGGRIVPLALGVADGLEVAETNGGGQPAGWRRRDGSLVFPTVRGIAVVDPSSSRLASVAPAAVVERVLVDGRPRPAISPVVVGATGDRRLEVEFTAPTFVRPELVRFRYRLSGFESEWRRDAGGRSASYTRLPPGRFRFEVEAAGEDGRFGRAASALDVAVEARFVETLTFRLLAAFALAAVILVYLRLRLRNAEQREVELREQVAERTHALAEMNANLKRLVDEQTLEIRSTRDLAILTLARLAELRDGTTGEHLERIARFSRRLAQALRDNEAAPIDEEFIDELVRSSPLHDIGKVAIPDAILRKPGPLTADEMSVMRTHTSIGGDTLRAVAGRPGAGSFLGMAAEIAYSHHERWDGGGYPRGLAGARIPLAARIVAVADAYDTITTERPYKPAHSHAEALRRIASDRGRHFDPDLVDLLLGVEDEFDRIRRAHQRTA